MRAIEIREIGGPAALQPVDRAVPAIAGPTDVLVRLMAAGVNPVDTKLRSRGPLIPDGLPMVPGCDGAGVVEAVGAGGQGPRPRHGGLALPRRTGRACGQLCRIHRGGRGRGAPQAPRLNFVEAAAAPLVLLTAWEALFDRAYLKAGQTVLIHAGAGGVGHVAIQLARIAGARVAATVSSPEKASFAHELGAEYTINYRDEDLVQAVMDWTSGRGADVAFDTVGPEVFRGTIPAMAHYGSLITILDPGPNQDFKEARNRNLRIGFELMLTPMLRDLPEARAHQGEILDRCAEYIDRGDLCIEVAETFALEQAADAHRRIEEGHTRGKLVLTMG